jgi:peptidylprolyl isomerase
VNKNNKKYGWLLAAVTGLLIIIALSACQPESPTRDPNTTPGAAGTAVPAKPTAIPPTPTPIVLTGGTTTASGLQYIMEVNGTGDAPKSGNLIKMHYIATLPDGTELANSYTDNQPATTVWGRKELLPGWEEGIGLMKVGGKIQLVIPPALAFGSQGSGSIPPDTSILMVVELLSSNPAPQPTAVTAEKLTKTASGLQYFDLAAGEGTLAAKSSSVSTDFTIWVKTEAGYDYVTSSVGSTPVNFVVGKGDTVFPGWEEGVTGMKVGGKRFLLIPSELGLGATGSGTVIPPNATLVMEISLVGAHDPQVATKVADADYKTTASGLKYFDLKEGTGASPANGQTVVVQYTGWLQDGTQFDSSIDSGTPFSFVIGSGNVIPGWDEGLATMKIGGKRQLLIPPALAYGASGAGNTIPPDATLIFEVELVEIKP